MATLAQLAANRLNAAKSTGPSPAGLAVTRFNALKSGLDAKSLIIPGEDAAELEALAENYRLQFQPASPVEIALLDTLVTADWELRRLRKIQPRLWSEDAFLDPDSKEAKRLARFHRRLDSVERSYYRALKELQKHAAARATGETAAPEPAAIDSQAASKLASFRADSSEPPTNLGLAPSPVAAAGPNAAQNSQDALPPVE